MTVRRIVEDALLYGCVAASRCVLLLAEAGRARTALMATDCTVFALSARRVTQ